MNVAKYCEDIDIVTNLEKARKLTRSDYFKRVVPHKVGHVVVVRHKNYPQVNHPSCIGYYILELSKPRLYDFFDNVIKIHYSYRVNQAYCDTDLLITETETINLVIELTGTPQKLYRHK